MGRDTLTQDELKTLVMYNPETGEFIKWKTNKKIGWYQSGYLKIDLKGKKYYLHRLVWLYVYGYFPINEIDHINNNRSDNRLINLREASREENLWNRPVRKDSTTGFKGVEFIKKLNKYRAVLTYRGSKQRLGTFLTAEEASFAYVNKASKLQGEFAYDEYS